MVYIMFTYCCFFFFLLFQQNAVTYSVLKKVRIQVFVESILKFDITLFPIDFIAERYTRALHQLHSVVAGQIDIHYLLTVVSDIELFVRPDVIGI